MKTKLDLLAAGIFLAAVNAGFGQPVITNQPATQATAPGTTVTFQVGATGTAPLAYQWQKNPGNGFSDLADHTNAALILANVQPWDAGGYRVVVTNLTGARTSAVARLYVMRTGLVTTKVVIDNFDDNQLTGWVAQGGHEGGQVELIETNQQFTVWGYWPGVSTTRITDTDSWGYLSGNWNVLNGQTLEGRVDLAGMSEHATAAIIVLWDGTSVAGYSLFKGRDFIHIGKPSFSAAGLPQFSAFFHESVLIKNTNVVMALAMTQVSPNVIITARILDKANNNAVLYERSVVDTPDVDRTLTDPEMEAASGMQLHFVSEGGVPITSVSHVLLNVFQYSDGTKPAAEVTYDNLERWTYVWRPEIAIRLLSTTPSKVNLTLSATPTSSWTIERALDLTGPWINLGALRIGTNGSAQFEDTNPAGFYRARQQ